MNSTSEDEIAELQDADDIEEINDDEELDEVPEASTAEQPGPPLTREEIEYAFRRATTGFSGGKERWAEHAKTGLTDEQLAEALKYEIGTFGGQAGPCELGISYQGNGLKIWIDRGIGSMTRKSVFAGTATVKMAPNDIRHQGPER